METRGAGVHVTALCPGLTRSEFHDANGTRAQLARIPGFVWQTSEAVARAGFAAVQANRAICVPGAVNKAMAAVVKLLPEDWLLGIVAGSRYARESAKA
jgi:short-subunit dehydrogenase